MSDRIDLIRLHVPGAPALNNVIESTEAAKRLVEELSGAAWTAHVFLRCDAPDCDSRVKIDPHHLEQETRQLTEQGWTRDLADEAHHCPTCSQKENQ